MVCFYFFNLYVFRGNLLTFFFASSCFYSSILHLLQQGTVFLFIFRHTYTYTFTHTQTFTYPHTYSHPCTLIFTHILSNTHTHMPIHRHSQKLYTLTLTHIKHRHACFNLCRLFFIFFLFIYLSLWVIPFVKTFNDVIKSLAFFFPLQRLVIDTSVFRVSCFLWFSRPVCPWQSHLSFLLSYQ